MSVSSPTASPERSRRFREQQKNSPNLVQGARICPLSIFFSSLLTKYLRVPHPRLMRVGSYVPTSLTLFSSLLGTLDFSFVVADLQVGSWGRSRIPAERRTSDVQHTATIQSRRRPALLARRVGCLPGPARRRLDPRRRNPPHPVVGRTVTRDCVLGVSACYATTRMNLRVPHPSSASGGKGGL